MLADLLECVRALVDAPLCQGPGGGAGALAEGGVGPGGVGGDEGAGQVAHHGFGLHWGVRVVRRDQAH